MPTVKKNEGTEKKERNITSVEVTRAKQLENSRVIFDAYINDIMIYGLCAFPYKDKKTGENTWGVSLPQRKGSDNRWYNNVYIFINDEWKGKILKQIDDVLAE